MKNSPGEEPLTGWEPVIVPAPNHAETRPLVAVTTQAILTERGELFTREGLDTIARPDLKRIFRESVSSIFVCDRALPILGELAELFAKNPRFQYEIFSMPKEAFNPDWIARGIRVSHDQFVVNRVGLRARNSKRPTPGVWHLLIDCMEMSGGSPEGIVKAPTRTHALLEWGKVIRKLVREFDVKARPTNGGIAAQILRSAHFYPRPRRRVPKQTNETCRIGLRGNHYDWTRVDDRVTYERVLEIDQQNAHHHAAASLTFPASDSLFARMSFRRPRHAAGGGLKHTAPGFDRELSRPGMFQVELYREQSPLRFQPTFLDRANENGVMILSNELPYLDAFGIKVSRITSAWTAEPEPKDEGICAYGLYCLDLYDRLPAHEWRMMKRTLLTLYGVLGARPKPIRRYYAQSKHKHESVAIRAGHRELKTLAAEPRDSDPFTANVIQRAMIEAETAWRSISLANDLQQHGHEVLAIYADALYVQSDAPPLLAAPWRIKHELRTAAFPRTGVVLGTLANGDALNKIPGGLRKEVADKRAPRPWEVSHGV